VPESPRSGKKKDLIATKVKMGGRAKAMGGEE